MGAAKDRPAAALNSGPVATADEKVPPPGIEKSASYSSNTSATSDDDVDAKSSSAPHDGWLDRANPLKRSNKPPVPTERDVSREYGAGFFSLLTFQWMAPLMSVSCDALFSAIRQALTRLRCRLATREPSS